MIPLRSGDAHALIDPDIGAGLATLRVSGLPILCPAQDRPQGSPFSLGMNLLAPFSNRLSRDFAFAGQSHHVPANLPGEPFAIHGDAFQKRWTVHSQSQDTATLVLDGNIGPFCYDARVCYALQPDSLSTELVMTNRAAIALPFGGGFHPWFHRSRDTRIMFHATGFWPEDERHLPATSEPAALPPALDFAAPAPLPDGWINAGFSGWDGRARIAQPRLDLTIEAPGVTTALLYSPGSESVFFCLEPVTHPVDAHNLPGQPGLVTLAPGDSMSLAMRIAWTVKGPTNPTTELPK